MNALERTRQEPAVFATLGDLIKGKPVDLEPAVAGSVGSTLLFRGYAEQEADGSWSLTALGTKAYERALAGGTLYGGPPW